MGERYQQKYLRWEWAESAEDAALPRTIAYGSYGDKRMRFYYEVNPFYVDLLDPEVTKEFLRCTHERYRDELGTAFRNMAGFFTDEPQVSRNGIPWSLLLPDTYQDTFGEDLLPRLPELFYETGEDVYKRQMVFCRRSASSWNTAPCGCICYVTKQGRKA